MPFATVSAGNAQAETRSLKLYYLHTGEHATITFKRNGKFDKDGLQKLNRFLRDWRRNEPTRMDPRLFDLIWEVYRRTGSHEYINVLSAYRAPQTNAMLRSRSKGVAKNSQHILGKAMDFFIPGVPLKKLREIGLKLQIGGVGYYPTSGSPFVHMDVGGVRAWPRASRQDLVRLFPDGKTLHIPPDGKPLPGYQAALADYKKRVSATSVEVASSAGSTKKRKNLLQILFGGGDEDEEPDAIASNETVVASAEPASRSTKPEPQVATSLPGVNTFDAPVPGSRPALKNSEDTAITTALVQPEKDAASEAIAAALPGNAPAEERFADLSQYQIPLPDLLGPRRLPGDAEVELAQLGDDKIPEPMLRPDLMNALTEATPEVADADDADEGEDDLAALLNRIGDEEPVDQTGETTQQLAMLDPNASAAPLTRSLAGQVGHAGTAPTPASGAELAALPSNPDDVADKEPAILAPKKGARPGQSDADAASRNGVRTQPRLTRELIAQWALSNSRMAVMSKPVKAPRFVSRVMRAQPKVVYAAGFSTDENYVNPDRFAGSAVNFMQVKKF